MQSSAICSNSQQAHVIRKPRAGQPGSRLVGDGSSSCLETGSPRLHSVSGWHIALHSTAAAIIVSGLIMILVALSAKARRVFRAGR